MWLLLAKHLLLWKKKAFRWVGEEDLKLIGFLSFFFLFFNCESGFASRTPSYLERFVAGALGSLSAYVISILSIRRAPLCFTEFWRRVEQEQAGLCLAAHSASHVTLWLRASTAALSPALMEMGIPQIIFSVLLGNSTAFSWVRF